MRKGYESMSHDHSHSAPSLASTDLTPAFRWGVALNAAYVLVEALVGFRVGSLSLLADAAHNMTDVAGLLIAWAAAALAAKAGNARFTWGFGRATLLAALANGVAILMGSGAVVWEAVSRFTNPLPIEGGIVIGVALLGIAVNAGTAFMFSGHRDDLNARGAYLHMAADAAVSLAVVLGAAGMMLTGWAWLDPAIAIGVSLLIAVTAWQLIVQAGTGLMDAVPSSVDRAGVIEFLTRQPGVADAHDLHIWPLSSTRAALSVHLSMPGGHPGDALLHEMAEELEHQFAVAHTTLQVEIGPGVGCATGTTCDAS